MRQKIARISSAYVLLLVLVACATLPPGADPIVVRAEQTLSGADAVYGEAMAYYYRPGVAPTLGKDAIVVFEAVRTGYDGPYKAVQSALDTYKAIRAYSNARAQDVAAAQNALLQAEIALAQLVNRVLFLIPNPAAKPVAVGGA